MSQYTAVVSLDELTAATGFTVNHGTAADFFGASIAGGDFNKDGFADVLIGAPGDGSGPGGAYVLLGSDALGTSIASSALTGSSGFKINAAGASDFLGGSVSVADLDHDGFSDLIMGATLANANVSGAAFVVYGSSTTPAASLNLGTLAVGDGFRFDGIDVIDKNGLTVSAGDINGDHIDDLISASWGPSFTGGNTYVVFGQAGGAATTSLAPGDLDGTNGFVIKSNGAFNPSFSIAGAQGAGDFNGDGYGDVLIHPLFGADAFVVYGGATWTDTFNLTDIDGVDGSKGMKLTGIGNTNSSLSLSTAGDVNGDGYADVLISGSNTNVIGSGPAGVAQLVFGRGDGAATLDTAAIDGTNGTTFTGTTDNQQLGAVLAAAGDMNGDGFDDFVVGSYKEDTPAYVVFGKPTGWTADFDVSSLNGENGFAIDGAAGYTLVSAASVGDVNGDGLDDLAVTDQAASAGGGAVSIIYGVLPDASVNRTGSEADQKIHGSNFDDTLSGLGGSDTLMGHDGNDLLKGGLVYDVLDGGDGTDTVDYSTSTKRVIANLGAAIPNVRGGEGRDSLISIENVVGSSHKDQLTGSADANRLEGGGGRDLLDGGDGADTLLGQGGSDKLTGGTGADVFVFDALDGAFNRITDLETGDTVDLGAIDAVDGAGDEAFTFVAAFTGTAGEAVLDVHARNGFTDLLLDTNGDSTADYVIRLNGDQSDFTGWVL